jgi:hypothetical protein
MSSQQPNPPPNETRLQGWANVVKGLSLTNALVIVVLVIALVPAYLLYTLVNDKVMMGKFLSSYEEISSDKTPCTLRVASLSGSGDTFGISTGFAYEGSDKWVVSVILTHHPDAQEIYSYCATLNLLVDFMRRPNAPSPSFPNTDKPLIWQYPSEIQ